MKRLALLLLLLPALAQAATGGQVTLHFTLPSLEVDSTSACSGVNPLRDLDSAYVYVVPRWGMPRVFHRMGVRGREGRRVELSLAITEHATVFVITADIAGNRSCASNHIGVNPPNVSVSEVAAAGESMAYDVAGRRMKDKRPRGIYFWRRK